MKYSSADIIQDINNAPVMAAIVVVGNSKTRNDIENCEYHTERKQSCQLRCRHLFEFILEKFDRQR